MLFNAVVNILEHFLLVMLMPSITIGSVIVAAVFLSCAFICSFIPVGVDLMTVGCNCPDNVLQKCHSSVKMPFWT